MEIEDKFIAFIDILGFTQLVEHEEQVGEYTRSFHLMAALGSKADADKYGKSGPQICPKSQCVRKDLNFRITQISDCVIVSAEISPAGIVNLAWHCHSVALNILNEGALCRGAITRGNIHHDSEQFVGTGYMRALGNEKGVLFHRASEDEKGTPFIEIDNAVSDYIQEHTDECVRRMFQRMTRTDGTYSAIYPFAALANVPAALVQPGFDPQHWKTAVQRSLGFRRENLAKFEEAERCASAENVRQKIRHYKQGLEEVIARLKLKEAALDRMIETGVVPYGTKWG
jgi:hypothetical protein